MRHIVEGREIFTCDHVTRDEVAGENLFCPMRASFNYEGKDLCGLHLKRKLFDQAWDRKEIVRLDGVKDRPAFV